MRGTHTASSSLATVRHQLLKPKFRVARAGAAQSQRSDKSLTIEEERHQELTTLDENFFTRNERLPMSHESGNARRSLSGAGGSDAEGSAIQGIGRLNLGTTSSQSQSQSQSPQQEAAQQYMQRDSNPWPSHYDRLQQSMAAGEPDAFDGRSLTGQLPQQQQSGSYRGGRFARGKAQRGGGNGGSYDDQPSWRRKDGVAPPPPGPPPRPPPGLAPPGPPPRPAHSSGTPRPTANRSAPRQSYQEAAAEVPRLFPNDEALPSYPLPLLVLDLNGTLVYRPKRTRNASPIRRPYLSSFLAYCLGIEDMSYAEGKSKSKAQADEEANAKRQDEWRRTSSPSPGPRGAGSKPHGSHHWSSDNNGLEPAAHPQAAFRLLVWSSAQPHNVDTMVKSILHPEQASQLMRCWARDTLVPKRLFSLKAPSIKDLEIVWNALNPVDQRNSKDAESGGSEEVVDGRNEGERRVMAQYRDECDHDSPDEGDESDLANPALSAKGRPGPLAPERKRQKGAASRAASRSAASVQLSSRQADNTWSQGRGWGPHNTLLLDDSASKAALQPFNHLLIPEFTAIEVPYKAPRPSYDTVLLQAVGVLEHARHERSMCAWIHSGGLGGFAGQQQPGAPAPTALAELSEGERQASFEGVEGMGPRLDVEPRNRTERFWEEEGKRALEKRGIAILE